MKGAYDDKTDEELVKLALQKQEHFVYLINRYQHKLLRYIKRISNFSVEETEDILQEVFIKVYRNLEGFDQSLKFSSWIYRIAHNQTISHFRKSRAGPNLVNPQTAEKLFKKLAQPTDIEKEIGLNYLAVRAQKAISQLDLKYRQALVLRFLEEKSYQEISDILKKPAGTIATLINRGWQKLKKMVGVRPLP